MKNLRGFIALNAAILELKKTPTMRKSGRRVMAYLECKCGQGIFVKVSKLKDTQVGGVVDEVAGWRCFECGEKVETAELLKIQEIKRKKKELATLQKEVNDADQREKTQRQTQGQKKPVGNETESDDKPSGEDSLSKLGKQPGV